MYTYKHTHTHSHTLGVELLDQKVCVFSSIRDFFKSFSKLENSVCERPSFSRSSPTLGTVRLNFSHSRGYIVAFHFGFNLHFPDN